MSTTPELPPNYQLKDGAVVPAVGLGTAPLQGESAELSVERGIAVGYRLIDTGAIYGNEAAVGRGVRRSGLVRDQIQVLTKLRGRDHGRVSTIAAAEESLAELGLDYVDFYLIHWPMPLIDKYLASWEAMITLRERGLVKSIGVSNFLPEHLERLRSATGVVPSMNQIELHPGYPQDEVRAANAELGIQTLGYSPLGHGTALLSDAALVRMAADHQVDPAQVALRWQVQLGSVPLPRTATPSRQAINLDIFGFELTAAEVDELSALPIGRIGWDPATREEL